MADPIADASGFASTVQGYATVGVSIFLGIVGIYGYFKKFRGDDLPPPIAIVDSNMRELVGWLTKLLEAGARNAESTHSIEEMIKARTRQDEVDRAYQKGRDEALDKAAALVAQKLKDGS